LFFKIYEGYYRNYLFLRKKKLNLFKFNLIIGHNSNNYNNIFYINYYNKIKKSNLFKIYYFYDLYLLFNLNILSNNYNNLYKFKKLALLNNIKKITILHTHKFINENKKFH
jgi:hypothetical protein